MLAANTGKPARERLTLTRIFEALRGLGYNRRFLQMCSHYLVEPVACTPASGWEKGQVENQIGLVRERLLTPRVRVSAMSARRECRIQAVS